MITQAQECIKTQGELELVGCSTRYYHLPQILGVTCRAEKEID